MVWVRVRAAVRVWARLLVRGWVCMCLYCGVSFAPYTAQEQVNYAAAQNAISLALAYTVLRPTWDSGYSKYFAERGDQGAKRPGGEATRSETADCAT